MKLFIIIIIIFTPITVFATTTGLSQAKFEINGKQGEVITKELWVTNIDTITQKYELKVDNVSFAHNVNFIPQKFNLVPNEFKKIVIRFRIPNKNNEIYLSLLSFDANQTSRFRIGNGIKIFVKFNLSQTTKLSVVNSINRDTINLWNMFIWVFDMILLIGFTIIVRARKMRFVHERSKDYKINFISNIEQK